MRVGLCGGASVTGASGATVRLSRPQPQVALGLLVLERHRPVSREELAHVLWGDELSAHWSGAVRGVLTRVRDALDAVGLPRTTLTTTTGQVHLHLPKASVVDVEQARALVERADRAAREGRPEEVVDLVGPAVSDLARGFLPGIDLAWVDDRRRQVEGLHRRGVRLLAEGLVSSGRAAAAVTPLQELVEADPYDEAVHRSLIRALHDAGDRTGAVAAFEACRSALTEDLGVGLSAETLALEASLAGSRSLTVTPPPATSRPTGATARRPSTPAGTFVGRRAEQALLVDEVVRRGAASSAGLRVVVVEGEAGVGKTRLAHEVADTVESAGVRVLWGRCGPDTGLPYEPVAEALATVLAAGDVGTVDLEDLRADLVALVPDAHLGADPTAGTLAGELDRARLFRAAALAFERYATGPVLWVVDDLQWASPDTLALIGHVGAAVGSRTVTLLATTRERPAEVARTLAHLARGAPLRVLPLDGLAVQEVDDWLQAAAVRPHSGLAAEVHDRTGGNPFFVGHLLRAAVDAGGRLDPDVVPDELQSFLDQRIASQPPDAGLVLAAASVAGPTVGFDVLQAVTGLGDRELFAASEVLVVARLLHEDPSGRGLRFAHALVRDAVGAGIGPSRRAWFHQRTAEAILAATGGEGPGVAAELARHFGAAGPAAADRARRWSIQAAEEALDQAAWVTARDHVARARIGSGTDADDRIRSLVAEGRARRGLGDRPGSFEALEEAVSIARVHRRPRRLAESVLAMVGGGGRGVPDHARHRWVSLIDEALAGLGPDDLDLRAPLLGSRALALLLTDRDVERTESAEEALRVARASGSPVLVAQALLDHRQALVGTEHVEQRVEDLHEVLALTHDTVQVGLALAASVYEHEELLVLGDRVGARASLDRAEALLERHPDPYWGWSVATWRALGLVLDGDLAEAEAAAESALARVAAGGDPAEEAVACFGVTLVLIRILQRRSGEVVELLDAASAANPTIPCYRAVLALCLAEAGEHERAEVLLDEFAADGFASVPHDTNRLLTFAVLADVAGQRGRVDAAPALLAELAPHAGRQVFLNCYGGGGAAWGPVTAQLAGLASLLGDDAAAARWRDEARAASEAFGAPGLEARTATVLAATSTVQASPDPA